MRDIEVKISGGHLSITLGFGTWMIGMCARDIMIGIDGSCDILGSSDWLVVVCISRRRSGKPGGGAMMDLTS